MTFIHGYLLGGLVLAGVPVLLHLIMRQKPKRLPFPAFRFLKARRRSNQRKLRFQHLLLLLLRMLVVVALCLALARPRVFSGRFGLAGDRPVSAVLLFDTSASMEFSVGGISRLEEAQQRGRELLDEMDPASRVAILDSGDDTQETLLPLSEARTRLEALRIRPAAGALNRAIDRAVRLLGGEPTGEDDPPRFLAIFSDRTRASWEAAGLKPAVPEGVNVVYIDVGVEKPRDLAIDKVEVIPKVAAPGSTIDVRVNVRGTLGGHENELSYKIDNEPDEAKRPVQLGKEQTGDLIVFDRKAPKPPAGGPLDMAYQVTVSLGTRDVLPFNNNRYATFLVRGSRKLLTLVEKDPNVAQVWKSALDATRSFDCEVITLKKGDDITDKALAGYPVIVLFQVSDLSEAWVNRLAAWVRKGGALAIIPGGEELLPLLKQFDNDLAGLLPAPLLKLASPPAGKREVFWDRFSGEHPLMAPFVAWIRQVDPDFARDNLRPFVRRYWQLDKSKMAKDSTSVTAYADKDKSPALAERALGKGRVMLFTTPFDVGHLQKWTDYLDSSFGLVLIDRVCRYLGGEVTVPRMNFRCGETVQVQVPAPIEPPYTVSGPGLAGAERNLQTPAEAGTLAIPQAQTPGNYVVLDGKGQPAAGFSINVDAAESDLERVPVEELEAVLGKDTVIEVGRTVRLHDVLTKLLPPPLELLPYLMILLLLVLALESLLANRFYRRVPSEESGVKGLESEVNGQKTGVSGQKAGVRSQESEVKA